MLTANSRAAAAREIAAIEEGIDVVAEETAPASVGPLDAVLPLALDLLVALLDQAVER